MGATTPWAHRPRSRSARTHHFAAVNCDRRTTVLHSITVARLGWVSCLGGIDASQRSLRRILRWVSLRICFRTAAARHPAGDWHGRAQHVLSICACVTYRDAPAWVIFDTPEGVGWQRWPDGPSEADEVLAPLTARGHADPAVVLAWLRGQASDPWGATGDGYGDAGVLDELRRKITSS